MSRSQKTDIGNYLYYISPGRPIFKKRWLTPLLYIQKKVADPIIIIIIKNGKRLIIKLYNAGKLIISNLQDFSKEDIKNEADLEIIDKWILARSYSTAKEMAKEFNQYGFSKARKLFEGFFWKDFCDNYLEIIKGRLWNIEKSLNKKKASAQYALYYTYLNILKMISPFLPHITEEMYHTDYKDGAMISERKLGFFFAREKEKSIHFTSWPTPSDKVEFLSRDEIRGVELMLKIITEVRKYKTDKQIKLGAELPIVILKGKKKQEALLGPFLNDLSFVIRAKKILFQDKNSDIKTSDPVITIDN